MNNFVFATICLISLGVLNFSTSYAKNLGEPADTALVSFKKREEGKVILSNDTKPIRVRKGDILTIEVGDVLEPIQVRVHSSLGRLVKHFRDVTQTQVSMSTDELQPGIYMVVIKRFEEREIRRVLVTEDN